MPTTAQHERQAPENFCAQHKNFIAGPCMTFAANNIDLNPRVQGLVIVTVIKIT